MPPVDVRFPLSAPAERISDKDTTKRVDPWVMGAGTPTRGLADRKDTTDSMETIEPTTSPRPAPACPTCGSLPTLSNVRALVETGVIQADYVCAFDHPWLMRWMGSAV